MMVEKVQQQEFEAGGHIAFTLKTQSSDMLKQLSHCIQSRTPVQGVMPPTTKVGLPAEVNIIKMICSVVSPRVINQVTVYRAIWTSTMSSVCF